MVKKILTFDAKKVLRGNFKASTAAEKEFYRQLKKVAQASGHIVERHTLELRTKWWPHPTSVTGRLDMKEMQAELEAYSKKLGPWAERQARKMLATVLKSNRRAYAQKSKAIGVAIQTGFADTETGMMAASLLFEQVDLIKSIPLDAGLRAQHLAYEAALSGRRAIPDETTIRQIEEQLGFSTEVATSRALLIARTETARANAYINQSRAQSVGSRQYRWHNSGDAAVRPSHKRYRGKRLQGMIFSWDNPPTLDDGMTGNPGTFPNCRCFAEPILDGE